MSVFDWNASLKACLLNHSSLHPFKINAASKTNDVFNIENKLNLRTVGAFQIDAEHRHLVATVESATWICAGLS